MVSPHHKLDQDMKHNDKSQSGTAKESSVNPTQGLPQLGLTDPTIQTNKSLMQEETKWATCLKLWKAAVSKSIGWQY
jgi:hypothetical protein